MRIGPPIYVLLCSVQRPYKARSVGRVATISIYIYIYIFIFISMLRQKRRNSIPHNIQPCRNGKKHFFVKMAEDLAEW